MKKKIFCIVIMIILIITTIELINIFTNLNESELVNSSEIELEEKNIFDRGIEITLLGGGNQKDLGNTNSCGYIIRNKKGKLIIVDGGLNTDAEVLYNYIKELGNGHVDYWYITHPHPDHVGALIEILNNEQYDIQIENLYYSFNELNWYEKNDERGYETEKAMFDSLESKKIINQYQCKKDEKIQMDNIICEIIRGANPQITNSDNGNDSSMVFKMIATDVNKSIIFLGDAFTFTSKELLESPDKLKADAVQMAHHGQNGVTEEVYKAISPTVSFFNAPEWLYNNDNGNGFDSGTWKSIIVRGLLENLGTTNYMAFNGDQIFKVDENGFYLVEKHF